MWVTVFHKALGTLGFLQSSMEEKLYLESKKLFIILKVVVEDQKLALNDNRMMDELMKNLGGTFVVEL